MTHGILEVPDARASFLYWSRPPLAARAFDSLTSARIAYREQRWSDAEVAAARVVALANENLDADPRIALAVGGGHMLRGLIHDDLGDAADASNAFRQARTVLADVRNLAEHHPDHAADLGIACAACGEHEEAITLLRRALEMGEGTPLVRRWLAASLSELGQAEEAREVLADSARRAPLDWQTQWAYARLVGDSDTASAKDMALAWQVTGDGLCGAGRWPEALDAYRRADAIADMAVTKTALAAALLRVGREREALDMAREALKLQPDSYPARLAHIEALAASGGFEPALRELRELAARYPDDADVQSRLGQTLASAGRYAEAADVLRHAVGVADGHPWIAVLLAEALVATGELDEAHRLLDGVIADHPRQVQALRVRGELLLYAGDTEGALSDLERAAALAPNDEPTWTLLGKARAVHQDYDGAAEALERAVSIDPSAAAPCYLAGLVHAARDRIPEAIAAYRRAVELQPDFGAGWTAMAEALLFQSHEDDLREAEHAAARGAELQPDARAFTVLGNVLSRGGHLSEALDVLGNAVRLAPDAFGGHLSRARVLVLLDRPAGAYEAYERTLSLKPELPRVHVEAAEVLRTLADTAGEGEGADRARRERIERAAAHLREAVRLDQEDYESLYRLGELQVELEDYSGAKETLTRACDESAQRGLMVDVGMLITLGRVLWELGDHDGAIGRLRQALDLEAHDGNALAALGEAYLLEQRYDESIRTFRSLLEHEPDAADGWSALGEALRLTGKLDEAITSLGRARELGAADANTLGSLAAVHHARGNLGEALTLYDLALEQNPGDRWLLASRRDLLFDEGRVAEALPLLQQATERSPDDLDLSIEFADTLRLAGRYTQALSALSDILWRAPDNSVALRIQGHTLAALGDDRKALAMFERAAQMQPEEEICLLDLAEAQSRVGQAAEALATVQRALDRERTGLALTTQARLLSQLGSYDRAADAAREAVRVAHDLADGYTELGWSAGYLVPPAAEESLSAYTRAVALQPNNLWALKGRAGAFYRLGRDEKARSDYDRVVTQAPAGADIATDHMLGWCLFRLGKHQQAAETLARAFSNAVIPGADLLFDIGLNAFAAGDLVNGRDRYEAGINVVKSSGSPTSRGDVHVAINDLEIALTREVISGAATSEARRLLARLSEALAGLPTAPVPQTRPQAGQREKAW